jgi:hypothetical protein
MKPTYTNSTPHSPGYQEGHRISTEPYSSIRGGEEDRLFDKKLNDLTIKEIKDYSFDDIIFPF